jgi:ketosteroid isomerase-like protein
MTSNEQDLRAVLAVAAAEPAAAAEGDSEAYLALLAEDAVFLAPNTPAKAGAELRAWLSDFVHDASVEWLEYHDGETVVSGDLAVHDYAYVWRVTTRRTGQSVVGRGKGIQVLRRQPGGAWKLFRNIWNTEPPPG